MADTSPDQHAEYVRRLEELGDALADGLQALSDEFMQAAWLEDIEAWRQLRVDQSDGSHEDNPPGWPCRCEYCKALDLQQFDGQAGDYGVNSSQNEGTT